MFAVCEELGWNSEIYSMRFIVVQRIFYKSYAPNLSIYKHLNITVLDLTA